MTDTTRRFVVGEDILDALLLQGYATATVEFQTQTEQIEIVLDEQTTGLDAIYRDQ
jgi:hypothetical protein